eukprot:CAMPEP_0181186844 /NCGR_PEP_ID=MMETSP1096-20121128/10250_1 /TAXON_ID=156174 ORGANISM="Chrysochromulina ericina, Strain CCMP281" /NCGR_SAMPLE_ID=MMETSP1096 /ASSEMBLY_ACC=CAM_ASM_000453 /LENGTH=113 /DNA_ID=CAMNT_0023275767 /DNA_START=146 /DNA_END=488 /DNA_ORIENTATION=+
MAAQVYHGTFLRSFTPRFVVRRAAQGTTSTPVGRAAPLHGNAGDCGRGLEQRQREPTRACVSRGRTTPRPGQCLADCQFQLAESLPADEDHGEATDSDFTTRPPGFMESDQTD